jgi:DNA-binding SARP family transcriptional activator
VRPVLHIELLGHFRLSSGDVAVPSLNSLRIQSLLAYLVLNPGPHSRQHLAFLFWPESTEAQARTNLRRELHHLRRAIPDADVFLSAETNQVLWRRDAPYTLDAATFEAAIAEAERRDQAGDRPGALAQLTAAVRSYAELLPGGYDDWLLAERERLSQRYASALERLVSYCESAGDWPAAINWAQRQLQHDPLREATYRDLIRLHRLNEDRSSALRVYHNCATILQRELGVEPEAATQALYRQLITSSPAGQTPAAPVKSAAGRPALIGRQREWAIWEAAWLAAAGGRPQVLCLAGEAGIGKTRLAEDMLQAVSRQGVATAWAACYAAESELPFAPVAEWLKRPALRPARAKLPAVWLAELVRLLPELLIERPDLPPPQPLTENWQRLRLFEALARAVLAARQPLLLVIDDVQWCDADTLAWLRYLLRFDLAARLLLVFTLRAEELPAAARLQRWLGEVRQSGQLTEVSLGALNVAETAALAAQLVGRSTGADFARWIYRETEGNPLFVVETVRTTTHQPASALEPANLELPRPLPGGSAAEMPPPCAHGDWRAARAVASLGARAG